MSVDVSIGSSPLNVPLLNTGGIAGFIDTSLLGNKLTPSNLTTTNGTTAGTVNDYALSFIGQTIHGDFIEFSGYENDTASNQTVNFKNPYTSFAYLVSPQITGLTVSVSTTGITITTPVNTTLYSGAILIMGI
jgi:hypothetical protein